MNDYFVWLDTSGPEITVAGIHERLTSTYGYSWAERVPVTNQHWALNYYITAVDELEAYKLAQLALQRDTTEVWFCTAERSTPTITLREFRRIYAQETQPIRGEPDAEAVPQTDNSG